MESTTITNVQELQAEIQRLKLTEAAQRAELSQRFSGPGAVFTTVKSLFPKKEGQKAGGGLLHPDIVNLVSRFAIPFTLNKTYFRHSNFLVKALVGLVSQKAAGLVTESSAENVFSKGKALLTGLFQKKPTGKLKAHE